MYIWILFTQDEEHKRIASAWFTREKAEEALVAFNASESSIYQEAFIKSVQVQE